MGIWHGSKGGEIAQDLEGGGDWKELEHLEVLGADMRIILKGILKERD